MTGETLILVPTAMELRILRDLWSDAQFREIGFGVAASGVMAAYWIGRCRPRRALLLGIAGSYRDELAAGQAVTFGRVAIDGIGVGAGAERRTAGEMGWGLPPELETENGNPALELEAPAGVDSLDRRDLLLTVCSASENAVERKERANRYPDAVAEDMEGYAVALACRAHRIPLTIIRGISNRVGDRDHSRWQIDTCLQAVVVAARQFVQRVSTQGESI